MAECCIYHDLQRKDSSLNGSENDLTKTSAISLAAKLTTARLFPSLRSPRLVLNIYDPERLQRDDKNSNSLLTLRCAARYLAKAKEILIGRDIANHDDYTGSSNFKDKKSRRNGNKCDEDLLQSVLLRTAYVYLTLDEPSLALQHLKSFFSCYDSINLSLYDDDESYQQSQSEQARQDRNYFLAHFYYLTALTQLGREREAAEFLEQRKHELISVVAASDVLRSCHMPAYLSAAAGDCRHLAAMTLQVNKAVLLITQDELELAEKLLEEILNLCACGGHSGCFPAVRCLLYIYVRQGRNGKVLRLLQRYRQVPIL